MKIIFARHGESYANLRHEIANRGLRYGLTIRGRKQAQELASRLEKFQITRIYSSPLLRAIETTIILSYHLNIDYEIVDCLREFDCGIAEGRTDEAAWRLWKSLFFAWIDDQDWEKRIEGGESFYDLRNRFLPFIDDLKGHYGNGPENILCLTHGGLLGMMLPLVLVNVDTDFMRQQSYDYASFIVSKLSPDGLICTHWNGELTGSVEGY